jgi:hypothetical protein
MPKWMKVENLVKILKEERLEKKLKVGVDLFLLQKALFLIFG